MKKPVSISANGPFVNSASDLALAMAAAVILIEGLDRELLGAGRRNNASKERQSDKRRKKRLHGHSPHLAISQHHADDYRRPECNP